MTERRIITREDMELETRRPKKPSQRTIFPAAQVAELAGYKEAMIVDLIADRLKGIGGPVSVESRIFYSMLTMQVDSLGVVPFSTKQVFFQVGEDDDSETRGTTNMPEQGKLPVDSAMIVNRLGFSSFISDIPPEIMEDPVAIAAIDGVIAGLSGRKVQFTFGGRTKLKIGAVLNFPEGSPIGGRTRTWLMDPHDAGTTSPTVQTMGKWDIGDCLIKPDPFQVPFVLYAQEKFGVALVDGMDMQMNQYFAGMRIGMAAFIHGIFIQEIS